MSNAIIQGYTANTRTFFANRNIGFQNFLINQDPLTGRATGVGADGQLQGANDGRNIQIGEDIHLIRNCVTVVKGDDPAALIEVGCP